MTTIYVEFSDATETVITSVFSCPQDSEIFPNQATIDSSDTRYQAFIDPPPTPATIAGAAFAAGLAVTSAGTPAINGTYALGEATQSKIAAMVLTIQVNGTFPGSLTAYPWPDTSGAFHTFPSVAVFKAWATAISNYVAALDLYAAGVPGATLPADSATID